MSVKVPSPLLWKRCSWSSGAGAGDDEVEEAVAVEVFHDSAAGVGGDVDAGFGGDVVEAAEGVLGAEEAGGDEVCGRDVGGVAAELHLGDVEEPAGAGVVGIGGEERGVFADCALGTLGAVVHAGGVDGEEAGAGGVVGEAVLLLAEAEVGEAELGVEFALGLYREPGVTVCGGLPDGFELGYGCGAVAGVEELGC